MKTKAIITSCSNKFFPSIINLLGSIKANYPDHPPIYIYDLGLFYSFRKELELIEGVTVISMPHFCPHWRACYTWKTYIFAHPIADLNFYIDAGCQVLKPLDEDFEIIEKNNLLLLDTTLSLVDHIPLEYISLFELEAIIDNKKTFSAGIIGFSNDPKVVDLMNTTYDAAVTGLALGFSPNNLWRNKGKDRNIFIRNCQLFRHDQTLLNMFFQKHYGDIIPFTSHDDYSYLNKNFTHTQKIWHLRTQWSRLDYIKISDLYTDKSLLSMFNRLFIITFIIIKNFNIFLKKSLGIIKS